MVKRQGRALVINITVRHEDGAGLECGSRDRMSKYSSLLPQLTWSLVAAEGEVVRIVVSTRGALPKSTLEDLKKINIHSRRDLFTISLMFHTYMDYDASPGVRSYTPGPLPVKGLRTKLSSSKLYKNHKFTNIINNYLKY